ncbi:acetylornithine deacetylase [Sneathiella aquimaris]|uniref:acetylornithine deacetylase n=1 Tax=Sneathiella aquimaris TaxID=2599305 RepID=UPI00146C1C57|nr:acetylornithine deacetylase [Sneathiella aquimaris]
MTRHNSSVTLSILKDLVSFDTTSYKSNLQLIDYVHNLLSTYGIEATIIKDASDQKANLYAVIGPTDKPAVALSGHTDIVPVDGQDWTVDPFSLSIKNNRAYGRGTCDMKGFIASVLSALPALTERELKRPVAIVLSYDEEIGCTGVRPMIEDLLAKNIQIGGCIVGEPSAMKAVTAHTGKQVYRCSFNGTAMHSSLSPGGINAISYAGQVINEISRIEKILKEEKTDDTRFAYPHPTINIGMIQGGKAVNIVAEHCQFDVECRYPPGCDHRLFTDGLPHFIETRTHPLMAKEADRAGASCQKIVDYPAFTIPDDAEVVQLARRLSGSNDDIAVNYGTEAGLFKAAGFETVVCGPGDIAQAHQADEFIELEQLSLCDSFIQNLVGELVHDGGAHG